MNNEHYPNTAIQEAHLDFLLRTAFMYEDQLMAEAATADLQKHQEEDDPEFAELIRRTYAKAREKYEAQSAEKRRKERRKAIRGHIRRGLHIAACLVLILAMAATFAIAKVEFIRVRVMKMLVDLQADHADISIVEDVDASFVVPDGWDGNYYPAKIPDGYVLDRISSGIHRVVYSNTDGDELYFFEYEDEDELAVDTENAEIRYGRIDGSIAMIIQKKGKGCTILWCNGDRYFMVFAKDYETAATVAENVMRINK